MSALALLDERDVLDLDTFVARARRLDAGGAIRLTAHGEVVTSTVCVVPGAGLLGDGVVLGMRVAALARPARLDVVVGFDAVADRLARLRREGAGATELSVPPVTVDAPWAALAPPRSGWAARGELGAPDLAALEAAVRAGVDEIAAGAPAGSGAAAVADLRRRVWARPVPLPGSTPRRGWDGRDESAASRTATVSAAAAQEDAASASASASGAGPAAGLGFGAEALGFLGRDGSVPGPVTWRVAGRWQRLSTPAGHVLTR